MIDEPTSFKLFGLHRKYIESQNILINFRATWFIGTQLALFSIYTILLRRAEQTLALVQSFQEVKNIHYNGEVYVITVLSILGLLSAYRTRVAVEAAYLAIDDIKRNWEHKIIPRLEDFVLPGIVSGWKFISIL